MISKKSMLYDYMNILIIVFTFEWSKFGQNSNYLIKAIYTNLAYTHLVETIKLLKVWIYYKESQSLRVYHINYLNECIC